MVGLESRGTIPLPVDSIESGPSTAIAKEVGPISPSGFRQSDPYSIYVEPRPTDKYYESVKNPQKYETAWKWGGIDPSSEKFRKLKQAGWDLQPHQYKIQLYWTGDRWATNMKAVFRTGLSKSPSLSSRERIPKYYRGDYDNTDTKPWGRFLSQNKVVRKNGKQSSKITGLPREYDPSTLEDDIAMAYTPKPAHKQKGKRKQTINKYDNYGDSFNIFNFDYKDFFKFEF